MATTPHFLTLPSLLLASVMIFLLSSKTSAIGINYGTQGNLPPPQQVVEFIKTKTIIDSVKIYDANPDILRALSGTGIDVTIMVPNGNIPALANVENARQWVGANVLPFHQQTKIKYICVGNEILLTKDNNLISNLIPAMQSLLEALKVSGLPDMKVTTPNAFTVVYNQDAPSESRFNDEQKDIFAKILEFNRQAKSPFMISAYPYFMVDPNNVNYAIFGPSKAITDTKTGKTYNNMFDAVMDATYSAMNALGYGDVDIAVGETGWPSACDAAWCTPQNAANYNINIIKRSQDIGTPLMPNRHIDIYLFALFNEDGKPGPTYEKNWGLFKPDFSPVYDVGVLRGSDTGPPPSSSEKWCVAKQEATNEQLQANIDWVCSQGIDCKNISPDGICFDNNNMKARSSFVMNVYYQSKGGSEEACNFIGNQFNDPASSDVKLTLSSKDGISITMCVHRQILVAHSRFFAVKLSDRWSKQQMAPSSSPYIVEISDCDDVEVYIETLMLMYCRDLRKKMMRQDVSRVLGILKVSAAIGFDAGVLSCLEYLEAAPWSEDEEHRIASLLSELHLENVGATEVLRRVSVEASQNNGSNDEVLLNLLHIVLEGKDEKARRDMKTLVSKMLRENSSGNDLRKESLYLACDGCLHKLKRQFLQAAESDLENVDQIARQADNLHWILDILIDRQIAEDFLVMWASLSELSDVHGKVPVVHRFEISRVTARIFVGIGKGQILTPKEVRCLLLRNWLTPFYDDFAWMKRASKGLDRYLVEDGLSNTILTLPLAWQQEFFLAWFDRFLNSNDCPNIQRGFEVWWRRAFWRRKEQSQEEPARLRNIASATDNS